MKKQITYAKREYSGYDININFEQAPTRGLQKQEPFEKKYNVKIRKHDLKLIDNLAESLGCSRNNLINRLIWSFLIKGLAGVEEHDVRALIAETADNLANIDFESSWREEILQLSGYIPSTINIMKKCNEENFIHQYVDEAPYGMCQNSGSYSKVCELLKQFKG